jgi:hypothetical protein
MSPRAACRLQLLGFTQIYDYVAGKADWLAHGLPTEGEQAQVPRAKDVLRRDVVTAGPEEPVGVIAARVAGSPYGFALVVAKDGTLLGRLRKAMLDADPTARAEQVMEAGPSTIRAAGRVGRAAPPPRAAHRGRHRAGWQAAWRGTAVRHGGTARRPAMMWNQWSAKE